MSSAYSLEGRAGTSVQGWVGEGESQPMAVEACGASPEPCPGWRQQQQGEGHGAGSGEGSGEGLLGPPCFSLSGTPYAGLLSEDSWRACGEEFRQQACRLMGVSVESPLAVALAAGAVALPALIKLSAAMEKGKQDLRTVDQLPVELGLGTEFVFHPIFACPVSRDQATPDNPPMLLPCNHVLCQQSVLKIAKSRTRVFKCPYCPVEAQADNLRPLTFPDIL
ncbi:hypothetical protein V8C86DRAFT_2655777 [Haematococcus lacustris]